MSTLYPHHLTTLTSNYRKAFDELENLIPGLECLLIHSGSEQFYYADDRGINFQAFGHFRHWLPVNRPDQLVLIRPGVKPVYFQVIPADFWYEQSIDNQSWWADSWEIVALRQASDIKTHLHGIRGLGFIGENAGFANSLGIEPRLINPEPLLHYLDFLRAYKSPYEVEQLAAANALGLRGHQAAQCAFAEGGSEYAIHMAFLAACEVLEEECPYTNIVALDEKSAILHYQYKRRNSGDAKNRKSQTLLLDAGCRINGYCSDITRTSIRTHTLPLFISLLAAMEKLQQQLVNKVRPQLAYQDLQQQALAGVGRILMDHEILTGSHDEIIEQKLPSLFLPHGVGHLLGIQVHDVGGKQRNASGEQLEAPADAPALRNTRIMDPGMVFTVEPG
ncbi:MAG: Xaa-Pro dipeptidase, partial [Pseudohongiellaceae bacterium]